MAARHQSNLGDAEILLASQTDFQNEIVSPSAQAALADSSEIQEAINSFLGGLSGLLFTLSLIFFWEAPLISVMIVLILMAGWGGKAVYTAKKDSQG